jgi:4-hydroxybenzoyl-CoA thioesterase
MLVYERPIRFEEVDAARIVFFGRYLGFAHEAMEHLFSGIEGGYSHLILARHTGFPAVHVEMSFSAPTRYGDTLHIETSTAKIGNRSAVLRYRMRRAADGVLSAEVQHTVVTTDLDAMKSCDMPDDVRAALTAHLETP